MIRGVGSGPSLGLHFSIRVRTPRGPESGSDPLGENLLELRDLLTGVDRLRSRIERLERVTGASPVRALGEIARAVEAVSSSGLGLHLVATPTTLASREEVNAIPTSYSPIGPSFASSTSLPTLGGTYSGANGDDLLTFRSTRLATVGASRGPRIRVSDSQGNQIANLNFDNLAPGTPVALSNGLTLSLSAGAVLRDDEFQVNVWASQGTAVDPDQPFNGARNASPRLEPGLAVTAGSFQVNGVSIAVAASDTLRSVVDRISASAAGVEASFDAQAEVVRLVQRTPGSAPPISLASDSSGFLAAVKLAGASPAPGLDDERAVALDRVSAFAGVGSGDLRVNGVSIAIDPSQDSLNDVLARIDGSAARVDASFDPETGLVRIRSAPGEELVLEEGTSGLLAALHLAPGTIAAQGERLAERERALRRPGLVAEQLGKLGRELQELFTTAPGPAGARVRGELRRAIAASLRSAPGASESGGRLAAFGIRFDPEAADGAALELDRAAFQRASRDSGEGLLDLLLARSHASSPGGLLPSLKRSLADLSRSLLGELAAAGATGALLDRRA